LMANPGVMDQLLNSDPNFRNMPPFMRQMLQSDEFRQQLANPEYLRQMFQMGQALRSGGAIPGAGLGGGFSPFVPGGGAGNAAPNPNSGNLFEQAAATGAAGGGAGAGGPGANQLAALFSGGASAFGAPPAGGAATTGAGAGTEGGAAGAGAGAGAGGNPSPYGMVDPNLIQQILGAPGGAAGGGGGLWGASPFGGGFGGFGAPPAPAAPAVPPEERFQVQLQQLNEMGFQNASQNVRALLATNGNVHAAIEYILSGGGI